MEPLNRWKCSLCNVVGHVNNKNAHMNGKRHRRNQQQQSQSSSWMCSVCSLAVAVSDKDSHIATHLATTQATNSDRWTCGVCSSTMSIKDKDSHLAGAKQATNAPTTGQPATTGSNSWMCSVCGLAIAVNDKDSHLAAHLAAAQATTRWTCSTCDSMMYVNNIDTHLAGAKHRAAVALAVKNHATAQPPAATSLPPGWWECETCDRAPMQVSNKDAHLKSKGHRASVLVAVPKTKRWYVCTVCAKAILQDQMVVHNASHTKGRHWEKARRGGGGGGGSSDGDGGSSDYGDNAYAYEDDYDSEEEEGLSILRDIDTQWG
ncbi:hypothetical protein BDZ89DRAFT_454056 [Hymenopellis radicata]|nr:hypothetical protein BDZ89DRAFT_454056 [Hymenopellis radicata]